MDDSPTCVRCGYNRDVDEADLRGRGIIAGLRHMLYVQRLPGGISFWTCEHDHAPGEAILEVLR